MKRILIIDDEPEVANLICEILREKYLAESVTNGDAGLRALARKKYDLILMDLNMPGKSGYEMLRILGESEKYKHIPVIVISIETAGIRPALIFGAADFIAKPFQKIELIARVDAVLNRRDHTRRGGSPTRAVGTSSPGVRLAVEGKICIDPDRHIVLIDGAKVSLSPTEYRLLEIFLENKGLVLSRERIIEHLQNIMVTARTIDSHINHLRRKLGKFSQLLETVRSFGYRLSE